MKTLLFFLLILTTSTSFGRKGQTPEFHPYAGRRMQTYMGPTAVQHPYADNREMKYVSQEKYSCEPIFALLDKQTFDKTVDLECIVFPYVYDRKEKPEVARLEELRRSECFHLSIATCELNDKKVWKIKSEPITDSAQCGKLVATKQNKIDAAKQCQIQTSEPYKAEQKKLKEIADQKKKAEAQAIIDRENSFPNKLQKRTLVDVSYETQGRYTLGLGYSFSDIKNIGGIGAFYPFLQAAGTNKKIESYSLGLRALGIHMLAAYHQLTYEKVLDDRDHLGYEFGLGVLAFTPYVGIATDFKDDINLRIGLRIILNYLYFSK